MTYRKKLIEVALPLDAISEASSKEKSIRHGHPSTPGQSHLNFKMLKLHLEDLKL